jgi:hypothetical protein
MKDLLNDTTKSVFNIYSNELLTLLNDTYLDLSIKGFSDVFCDILQYKYAKTYADIVTKNVRLYGLTESEAEIKYNIKAMRKAFACNNIDIDKLFNDNKLDYYIPNVRPQLFNLHLCEEEPITQILYLADSYKTPLIANDHLLTFKI